MTGADSHSPAISAPPGVYSITYNIQRPKKLQACDYLACTARKDYWSN